MYSLSSPALAFQLKCCSVSDSFSNRQEGIKGADPEISPITPAETRILETMETRHPGSAVAWEQGVGDISVVGYMQMTAFTDKNMVVFSLKCCVVFLWMHYDCCYYYYYYCFNGLNLRRTWACQKTEQLMK